MKALWSMARIGASAALLYGGQGLDPLAWLMWLAPLPLMLYRTEDMGWRRAGAEALLASILGALVWWPYLSSMAPKPIAALAIVQPALVFTVGMLLMWLARRQGRAVLATLMLPLTVAACEILVTTFSPHGSFGSIAYTQSGYLPLMQVLAVTGLSGVTALLCWLPAAASAFWWRRSRAVWLAGPAFVVLGLVLWAGQQRMAHAPAGTPLRMALVADDAQLRAFNKPGQEAQVLAAYTVLVQQAAAQGARVAVLPEKTFSVTAARAGWLRARLQQLADQHGLTLVAGVNLLDAPKRNLAWLITPQATMLDYEKRHLVPGWETGYARGAAPLLAQAAGAQLGVAICKDLDFPRTMRTYSGRGLLLVPAWDFGADAWLHSRMALARSIEQGVPMARSAHEGRLTLSNAMGVVLHEAASDARAPVTLIGDLTPGSMPTIYARIGDAFGWLMVAAWIAAMLRLAVPRADAASRRSKIAP